MNQPTAIAADAVRVTVRGQLPGAADYTVAKVRAALRYAPEPVLAASVKLTEHPNPAERNRVVVQANVDMRGRLVRAQVAAETVTEAADRLHDRLRRRLTGLARNWSAIRGRTPGTGTWRHGSTPISRTHYFPRPTEEREVVRHKAFTLAKCSVDEAVAELELLDYDFHLFTEAGTDEDSVVYRISDEPGYRLAQRRPRPAGIAVGVVAVPVSDHPAAELSLSEAISRLELAGQPFLFFTDPEHGRGQVVYHRYDGHYGLITPA